jgi:hypothetical protein
VWGQGSGGQGVGGQGGHRSFDPACDPVQASTGVCGGQPKLQALDLDTWAPSCGMAGRQACLQADSCCLHMWHRARHGPGVPSHTSCRPQSSMALLNGARRGLKHLQMGRVPPWGTTAVVFVVMLQQHAMAGLDTWGQPPMDPSFNTPFPPGLPWPPGTAFTATGWGWLGGVGLGIGVHELAPKFMWWGWLVGRVGGHLLAHLFLNPGRGDPHQRAHPAQGQVHAWLCARGGVSCCLKGQLLQNTQVLAGQGAAPLVSAPMGGSPEPASPPTIPMAPV